MFDYWLLVIGYWILVIGYWLLVIQCRLVKEKGVDFLDNMYL
jgi:hypothetical protein